RLLSAPQEFVQLLVRDSELSFFSLVESSAETGLLGGHYAIRRDVGVVAQCKIIVHRRALAGALAIAGVVATLHAHHVRAGVRAVAGADDALDTPFPGLLDVLAKIIRIESAAFHVVVSFQ